MKRGLILVVLLLLLKISSAQALTVISDIDDTLKIAHSANPIGTATRALTRTAFTGMSETYQALYSLNTEEDPHQVKFIYLTARPQLLDDSTEQFLNLHQFPEGEIVLKGKNDPNSTEEYKIARIRKIITQSKDQFILIGDDAQADPEAYQAILEEFPTQVKAAYIHQVANRSLPPSLTRYLISYDLAFNLKKQNFLNDSDVDTVAQAVLEETREERILPRFQACPKFYEVENQLVAKLVRKICASRTSLVKN